MLLLCNSVTETHEGLVSECNNIWQSLSCGKLESTKCRSNPNKQVFHSKCVEYVSIYSVVEIWQWQEMRTLLCWLDHMVVGKMKLLVDDDLIMCSYGWKVGWRGRAAYHAVWQINIHSHLDCGTMLQMTSVLPVHISVSICVYLNNPFMNTFHSRWGLGYISYIS